MSSSDTLASMLSGWDLPVRAEERTLDQVRALDRFLAEVEKRAFRIAHIAVRDHEDALDIVQDAMLQLARRYGARPEHEWRPLFYRILQNRIRDCQRRGKVRSRVFAWFAGDAEEQEAEPAAVDVRPAPVQQLMADEAMQVLEIALQKLPARQQEAFMLRTFEGLDVSQTAIAMGCSQGSVKTHYSRAVHALRGRLEDSWGEAP